MTAAMTIPELFDAAAEAVPDKDWLFWEDERYTYAEAAARVGAAAAALADAGIGHGDLVLATARNEPAYLFTWLAVTRLGAIFVPVNPKGSTQELAGLAAQCAPRPSRRPPPPRPATPPC
jgi:acyl-CoA synthetase (AMP-forming)/AMP-acid ligase II